LTIILPKIIKIGGNLTKLWQKQFWLFETWCRSKKRDEPYAAWRALTRAVITHLKSYWPCEATGRHQKSNSESTSTSVFHPSDI